MTTLLPSPDRLEVATALAAMVGEQDPDVVAAFLSGEGIQALRTMALEALLLDPDAAWAGNQAVREMPQGGREAIDRKQPVAFDRVPSGPCRFVACQTGPVYQSLTFETSLPGCPRIVQTYRLFDDWLDVEDVFEKEEVLDPESIAIAFPFRVETPEFRVEIADAVMRPGIDQLPFSCYDFYSIQHWAVAGSGEYSVPWTRPWRRSAT